MVESSSSMNQRQSSTNRALDIVQAAKMDRARAEQLVLALVRELAPRLEVELATINESKLSLNSVNGRLDAANKKYFFKFHAEEGETGTMQNAEYYNAKILADAGWPVVQPVFVSTTPGSQFVVYDFIEAPTAFAAYEAEEERCMSGKPYDEKKVGELLEAEKSLGQKIRAAYFASLERSPKETIENASLFQLFYKRLVNPAEAPRLENYYIGKDVSLPDGEGIPFNALAKLKWNVNGIAYEETLEEIISKSKDLLNPSREETMATVIGHGDDHNGNRFIINGQYVFFDPAFAGRQPALLSYIKATAHNTFLHPQWLYDPQKLEGKLDLKVAIKDGIVSVDHNWKTEELSPLRMQVLDVYAKEVWQPLIAELSKRGWLSDDWQEYIRSALFCCPFLVLNLIDGNKYPPAQSLLALSKCVELGSKGDRETIVERFLNDIAP